MTLADDARGSSAPSAGLPSSQVRTNRCVATRPTGPPTS